MNVRWPRVLWLVAGCATLFFAIALVGCGGGGSSNAAGNSGAAAATPTPAPDAPQAVIQIADNSFTPQTLTIAPGTKVVWQWSGSNPHAVLINGEQSPTMTGSGSWDKTFRGGSATINYQCAIHGAAMSGKIVFQ